VKNQQEIIDDGDLRRYRTELPNMADDDLDPYQYRLYAHYKRVCGGNDGTCWESVRKTASTTKMSADKVIAPRQWLADNGWVRLKQQENGRYHITIINRWMENFSRYAPNNNGQSVRDVEQFAGDSVRDAEQNLPETPGSVRDVEPEVFEMSNQRSNSSKKEQTTTAREPKPKEEKQSGGSGSQTRHRQLDKDYGELCTAIEDNGFGFMTKMLADEANALLDEYPLVWILDALKVAVGANKRQMRYVKGILVKWRADGRDPVSPPAAAAAEPPKPAVYTLPPAAAAMKRAAELAAQGVTY